MDNCILRPEIGPGHPKKAHPGMPDWRLLLVSPDSTVQTEARELLAECLPSATVQTVTAYEAAAQAAAQCHLVLLDIQSGADQAFALLAELAQSSQKPPVIPLFRTSDPDMVLRCMRQGAAEFLIRPFTEDQLAPALQKAGKQILLAGDPTRGRLLCVIPAKGASGATTIACNLSFHLKKLGAKKLLLADLDPLAGTVSFCLKLRSSYSFLDVLHNAQSLDADVWKQLVTHTQGIEVLLSPESSVDGSNEREDPAAILNWARGFYDTVVVDAFGLYGAWNLALARAADEVLLVTTNELPALQATQRALAFLERNHIPSSRVKLLVNRYSREVGLSQETIETALHNPIYQLLPSDYEAVQNALMDGKPVAPGPFQKSVAALAGKLAGKAGEAAEKKQSNSWGGLFSLFAK